MLGKNNTEFGLSDVSYWLLK